MKTKQRRFDYYQPFGDLGNPEATGLIAGDKDFDYGTPNLERNEDLAFVASNANLSQRLHVRIKWRPVGDGRGLVTMISRMTLILLDEARTGPLEFEQIETYRPSESRLRSGRFTQYGSSASKLKLFVAQPYRRTRLLFNGHMRRASDQSTVFVKLGCVVNPVAQVFDFFDQYDESCLKQIYANKKPVRTYNQFVSNLLLHDRHEQKVRLVGELTLIERHEDKDARERKQQQLISIYGFYSRHFSSIPNSNANSTSNSPSGERLTNERNISTRRLYGYMNNGQAFHLATRKFDLDEVDFGYATFEIHPKVSPIDKPFKLDWRQLDASNGAGDGDGNGKFEFEVSARGLTFEGQGERKLEAPEGCWFQINTNGKPGWAWFSRSDTIVSSNEELEAIARSRRGREQAIALGKVLATSDETGDFDQISIGEKQVERELLVVSVEDDLCSDPQLVGSKAASLAHLVRFTQAAAQTAATVANYKVPHAFVLTKRAHDLLVEENQHLQRAIDELQQFVGTAGAGGEGQQELREKCKALVQLVAEQSKLPERVIGELWERLTKHYGPPEKLVAGQRVEFAVRSSSWGEDEEDMSAAGQLSTILSVQFNRDELAKATLACFASKFNYENIEYKRQHGLPLDLPMAVVVQEMVACQKAGVMFTCDPTTGDESLTMITANYGLGESVVSAQADPDSIAVRTNPQIGVETVGINQTGSGEGSMREELERFEIDQITVGRKEVIISGSGGDQVAASAEAGQDRTKCCLSNDEIMQLARCGAEIKRFFWSQRRDIEWGYLKGQLYLFQSRPVTGLESYSNEELMRESDRPSQAELGFYTRANLGEVMPYPITPLTLTYSVYSWNAAGARMFLKFIDDIVYTPYCSSEVFYEKFHAFFNIRCSILLPLSEAERSVLGKSLEIGFFGREMGYQPDIVEASKGFVQPPNPFQERRFLLRTMPLKLMPNYFIMKEKYLMDKLRAKMRSSRRAQDVEDGQQYCNPSTKRSMYELYNQMCSLIGNLCDCWENHINIIMFGSNNNMVLSAVLSKYIRDPVQLSAASNKFLALSPDVISAQIPERVERMAKLIKQRGFEELKRFAEMEDDKQALEYLQSESVDNKRLRGEFEEFLETFGHRCYNEFELAVHAWRERPEEVAQMVRRNCLALLRAESLEVTANGHADPTVAEAEADQENNVSQTNDLGAASRGRPKTFDEVIQSLGVEFGFKDRLLLKHLLVPKCQQMLAMREKTKNVLVLHTDLLREASRMLADEMQRQLRIPDKELFYYLMFDELKPLIEQHQPAIVCQASRRRQMFKREFAELWKFDEIIRDMTPNHLKQTKELSAALASAPRLHGTPASSGKVRGKICLVNGFKDLDRVQAGTILLTHSTDIAFSPVFPLITGIITEVGGLISHGAVVAREYGLPSVIGIPDVMRILQDGEEVILDADNGAIIRLSKSEGAVEAKGENGEICKGENGTNTHK